MNELWVEKYSPNSLDEVIGNSESIQKMREWAENWKNGIKQKPLLLYGKNGIGKTISAIALAKEYDFDLLELNSSDTRNAERIQKTAGLSSVSTTFSGKKRMILLDEIDGLFGNNDKGGANAILKVIQNSECPIIMTANDIWDMKLSSIRNVSEKVEFKKIMWNSIAKYLKGIVEIENKIVPDKLVMDVAKNASGDLRSAINDLQMLASVDAIESDFELIGERDREQSIYASIQNILKTMQFHKSRDSLKNLNEEPDFVLKWIDENIPREYTKPEDLKKAYDTLSRADIYLERAFSTRDYGFWKYASDLMTAGISLSKQEHYKSFTKYGFPSLIKNLSASKSERGTRKSIAVKIAQKTHVSTSTAIQDYIPMIKELINDKPAEVNAYFNFDEEELEFFGIENTKIILEETEKLKSEEIKKKLAIDPKQKGLNHFF